MRTLKRWAATSDYTTLFRELQGEHRTFARARATLWADDVLGVLYQLAMTDGRSQLVRYHAAAKLADILGLGVDADDRKDASGEELQELYAVLRAAKERARGDPAAYAPGARGQGAGGPADSLPYEAIELRRPVLPAPAVSTVATAEEVVTDAEFAPVADPVADPVEEAEAAEC